MDANQKVRALTIKLKELRLEKGFTIENVAQKLDIEPYKIEKIENSKACTLWTIMRIAAVYGIKLSEILKLIEYEDGGN